MNEQGKDTKLDLINSAFSKMAISGITAPTMPSDYDTALSRLEGMMYEFEDAKNVCCQYNFTDNPDTGDRHGMSFALFEPISNILAVRLLGDYAIPPVPALISASSAAISSLSAFTFQLRETQYPRRQARGAGNTLRYNRWQRFYRKPAQVENVCSTIRLDTGEINEYSESWLDYLRPGETISTVEVFTTDGVRFFSGANDGQTVTYRLEGLNPSIDNGVEQLRIRVTTNTGRKDERLIDIQVLPITTEPGRFTTIQNPTT